MSDDFLDTDENTALEDSPQTSEFDDLIGYIDKKYTLGGIPQSDITKIIVEKLDKTLPSLNLK